MSKCESKTAEFSHVTCVVSFMTVATEETQNKSKHNTHARQNLHGYLSKLI